MSGRPGRRRVRQGGAYAVEFAIVFTVFLLLVFASIEVARVAYLYNTLQEVTRRAARSAVVTDLNDAGAMAALRREAIFRATQGALPFGAPITDAHVRIDYLSLQRQAGGMAQVEIPDLALPACPARNRLICTADAEAANCVRFVRVRICEPGSAACAPVRYQPLLPVTDLPLFLPRSTTVARAESLGYAPGAAMCN